jgi:hypothetical protein
MNRVEMPRKRRREDEGNLQQKKEKKHQQQLRGVDEQNKPHSYLKRTAFDILKASKMGDKFGTLRGALKYYEVCEEIIKLGIANTDTERCCLDVTITVLFNLFESTYAERDKLIGELVKNKEERMELKAERQTIGLVPVYKGFSSIELFGLHSSIQTPPFEFGTEKQYSSCSCSCCDNPHGLEVTRAHLVPNSSKADYTAFNDGYSEHFDPASDRNRIPLCGSPGVEGSCRYYFDNSENTLLYNPLQKSYYWYSYKHSQIHGKLARLQEGHKPYRRVLVERARSDFVKSDGDSKLLKLFNIFEDSEPSEDGYGSKKIANQMQMLRILEVDPAEME